MKAPFTAAKPFAAANEATAITNNFAFEYPAVIDGWHDGDTCTVRRGSSPGVVFLGERVRVEGINAPELRAAGGSAAYAYAMELAPPGTRVTLTCRHMDKYGRLLARIELPDGRDFSKAMIEGGHAVSFMASLQKTSIGD